MPVSQSATFSLATTAAHHQGAISPHTLTPQALGRLYTSAAAQSSVGGGGGVGGGGVNPVPSTVHSLVSTGGCITSHLHRQLSSAGENKTPTQLHACITALFTSSVFFVLTHDFHYYI